MVDMRHFSYSHLPTPLAEVSQQFHIIAHDVLNTIPSNAERTTCLRFLLQAKDCAVRAMIEGPRPPAPDPKP
jgi:hypothetical protein